MDRAQDIHFVYENGVLRPEEPVNLPEGARGIARIRAAEPRSSTPRVHPRSDDSTAWLKAQESVFAAVWDNDEDAVYDQL
jgi:predicted DNA-binding antitoxin AbrB/MazE fold protein